VRHYNRLSSCLTHHGDAGSREEKAACAPAGFRLNAGLTPPRQAGVDLDMFPPRFRGGAALANGRPRKMVGAVNEPLLDQRLAALDEARAWSPRLISKLESHIRTADDLALFRINAFSFARERRLAENEIIDLFLHATALGLFSMDWSLYCPQCCCVVESFRSLKSLHNHYHCAFCQVGYDAALDEYIAVGFTVSQNIRKIQFHDPDQLSAWDKFFKTQNTAEGLLPDGQPLVDAKAAVARSVTYLPAGETTSIEIEVREGTVVATCPFGRVAIVASIAGAPAAGPQRVPVAYGDDKAHVHDVREMAPGRIVFTLANTTSERGMFAIAVLPPGFDMGGAPVHFVPFLNGKRLLTTQAFRDLFRSEVIKAREGIGVKDITLLFTDLKGSTALYDRIGDLNAFALVQRHFDLLQDVVARHHGAIIKTIGDAVMATFLEPADAVAAALSMRNEIDIFNGKQADRALILKIGIHRGTAIAVTLNERLDYFGQTVNIAARVQQLADAEEIFVSEDAYSAEGVQALLGSREVTSSVFTLKGVQQGLRVFRVAKDAAHRGSPGP
jgi:class 3 adenylate cyclase